MLLFLPARNEERNVAAVLERAPTAVDGHPVQLLVVDDGSSDATAAVARSCGADVVRLEPGCGLGAAVRAGLAEGARRGSAATAFCDADGEYAAAELDRLVRPILRGEADYVVGSRFLGGRRGIAAMRHHRRLGNRLLTGALAHLARLPISDGQSGYRALSLAAAREAEIVHDYNYAQVLTLDLAAKGHRYVEVPISYAARRHGRSFVRLLPYLRRVVPAVYAELRGRSAAT